MNKVTVDWYDVLKGIGEGKTAEGKLVFLNSNYVEANGHFAGLKKGEVVSCELKKNDLKSLYASKIVKLADERKDFNRTSFLDPRDLPRDPEPSL